MSGHQTSPPTYQIFPAVGVARVGNSALHSYLASEAPQIDFSPVDGYRGPAEPVDIVADPAAEMDHSYSAADGTAQRLKRMACRFRIYEFDANGVAVREITANTPTITAITWSVRLVNKKAAGPEDWGLGIAGAGDLNTTGPTTDQLTIDSGVQTIGGAAVPRTELGGEIMTGLPEARYVKLGDIETDRRGRLVVHGGHGVAESWETTPTAPDLMRNAGWFDDTSDGIVEATVEINNEQTIGALSPRVVIGPPDYAHPCLAPVTLFDLAFDRSGASQPTTSFTQDIHPLLHRTTFLEWTLFAIQGGDYSHAPKHGHGYTGNHDMHPHGDFLNPRVFRSLYILDSSDPDFADGDFRRSFCFDKLKDPSVQPIPTTGKGVPLNMPTIEGLTLTPVQYEHFRNLAAGTFAADWPIDQEPGDLAQPRWTEIDVEDRPAAMNRASMDFMVGGPFFPGVEVGAIAEQQTTWTTVGMPDPEIDFRVDDAIEPGDLTEALALPWQCGFNQHNYQPSYPSVPADETDNLWPSARPVMMPAVKRGTSDDRLWTRPLTQTGGTSIYDNQKMSSNDLMIEAWSRLGFLAPRRFYVEVSRTLPEDPNYL